MSDTTDLGPDDQRDLEALAARYRREHTLDDGPPPAIDRAIREAARQGARRRWRFTPFPDNWMVPASVVALLLLTVSIIHFMPSAPQPKRTVTTEDEAPLLLQRKAATEPAGSAGAMREKAAPAFEEGARIHGMLPQPELERRDMDALKSEPKAAAPASADTEQMSASSAVPSLAQWSKRISVMLEQGDSKAAEREMRALLVQYPDATFTDEGLRALADTVRKQDLGPGP